MGLWQVEWVLEVTLEGGIVEVHVGLEDELSKGKSIRVHSGLFIVSFLINLVISVTTIGFPELEVGIDLISLSLLNFSIKSGDSILELGDARFSAESLASVIDPSLK